VTFPLDAWPLESWPGLCAHAGCAPGNASASPATQAPILRIQPLIACPSTTKKLLADPPMSCHPSSVIRHLHFKT
jgi:hypothetical protein